MLVPNTKTAENLLIASKTDVVGTTQITLTFDEAKTSIKLINESDGGLTLTVGGTAYTVEARTEEFVEGLAASSATLVSDTESCMFTVEAISGLPLPLDVENNTSLTENIAILEDKQILGISIYGDSTAQNFADDLGALANVSVENNTYGGSMAGHIIAGECDEAYAYTSNENDVLYSNDLENAVWDKDTFGIPQYDVEKIKYKDGEFWNRITKLYNTAGADIDQSFVIPIGTVVGMTVKFDLNIIEEEINPMKSLSIQVENVTRGETSFITVDPILAEPKRYSAYSNATGVGGWQAGDVMSIKFFFNFYDSGETGVCDIKNINVSFHNYGYQSNVTTKGSAVSDVVGIKMVDKNVRRAQKLDSVVVQFGANDSRLVDGESYRRTIDKAMYQCTKKYGNIVITSSTPLCESDFSDWDTTDPWEDKSDNGYFMTNDKRFREKWAVKEEIHSWIKSLVSSGQYTIAELMRDTIHPTPLLDTLMSERYYSQLKKPYLLNGANSELIGNARHYAIGEPTGTWTFEKDGLFDIERRIFQEYHTPYAKSSTPLDTLDFGNIAFTQLFVLYRQNNVGGDFEVVIDEGLSSEEVYEFTTNTGVATTRQISAMVLDNKIPMTRSVKVRVASTATGDAMIHGITVI